jgi:DinB superfamily
MTAQLSRQRIVAELHAVHQSGVAYWSGFELGAFFAPIGAHWSPADHVRHLTKSMAPLSAALRLPRVIVRIAFGGGANHSRSQLEISSTYDRALAAGGTAGRFTPSVDGAVPDQDRRHAIMEHHGATVVALARALERWPDSSLDTHRLPHPLLGKLTVREMMLFTLIHNQHHVDVAERRRCEAVTGSR